MKVVNIFLFCITKPAKKAASKTGISVLPVRSWKINKYIYIQAYSSFFHRSTPLANTLFDSKLQLSLRRHQTNTRPFPSILKLFNTNYFKIKNPFNKRRKKVIPSQILQIYKPNMRGSKSKLQFSENKRREV